MQSYKTYYDLEIEQLINKIQSKKYKNVLLQFPDGLKQYSKQVIDELEKHTNANLFIYFGTCFGACDIPLHVQDMGIDLCVQWGHANFIKSNQW